MKAKKLIAVLMSLLLVFTILAPVSAVAQDVCECDEVPIIYVRGRASIHVDKDGSWDESENPSLPYVPDGFVEEALKELVPLYTKCYLTDDFEPFRIRFTEVMKELYKDYALDNNGELTNNSGLMSAEYWRNKTITDIHKANGTVDTPKKATDEIYKYFFQYDCRLDPCETADDLYDYIQTVKEVTGHQRIKILARCLGSNILSAYFAEYGWADVDDVIIYNPVMNGTAVTNSLFNGEIYLDADAVDFTATQELDDTTVFALLKEIITLSNKLNGLDMTMAYFNKTLTKVARLVIPDVMRVSYGTTPGYWSMVSADKYEEARDYIFAGVEDEYAGLIAKLDNYHETVGSKIIDMYKQIEEDGVDVSFIAKYGYQLYPIMKDASAQSDKIVTTEQQAPGTTCAPIGSTLSDDYIESLKADGLDRYLSPDKQIDASTTLFPDTTWYIKNMEHNCFPYVVDELIYKIMRYDGKMTVWDDPDFTQYIIYEGEENNGDTLTPMTEEIPGESLTQPGFFELIVSIFKNTVKLIGELIAKANK